MKQGLWQLSRSLLLQGSHDLLSGTISLAYELRVNQFHMGAFRPQAAGQASTHCCTRDHSCQVTSIMAIDRRLVLCSTEEVPPAPPGLADVTGIVITALLTASGAMSGM